MALSPHSAPPYACPPYISVTSCLIAGKIPALREFQVDTSIRSEQCCVATVGSLQVRATYVQAKGHEWLFSLLCLNSVSNLR